MNHSNLSRRELLRRLSLGAAAAAFSGCFRGSSQAVSFWGTGTLDIGEAWREAETLGFRVDFEDNKNDPGPVLARLIDHKEALTRHLSGLQGGTERELAREGAIIPWDTQKIPNFDRLWPWAKEIGYTVIDGERYAIPAVINADSIVYLPEFTGGTVDSYSVVFDPEFKGKTSMEDAWINSVIFTAIYLRESGQARIQDPSNLTETELREVMLFLSEKARAGQFRKLWNGWQDGVDLIVSKQVVAMTGWEPIVYEAQRQGIDARYATPKEGYEGWSNNLVLHPGAERDGLLDQVHSLVNWQLEGFYGCTLADLRGYVVPTDQTVQYAELHPQEFDVARVTDVVENVKRKFFEMKGRVYWQNCRPQNYRLYEEEWNRFRNLF